MNINKYKDIYEMKHGVKLIARIKLTEGHMEIFPVENSGLLTIEVKGNGFKYKSK